MNRAQSMLNGGPDHDPSTSSLYHMLAFAMTLLREAGEIDDHDRGNITSLIEWDGRRKKFVYRVPEWYARNHRIGRRES